MSDGQAAPELSPEREITREERIALVVLVLVGLGVRLYAGTLHRMPEFDATYYISYFRVPGWSWVFPPGYPAAIEVLRIFIENGITAARVVSALWGALLAVPVVIIARRYVSPLLTFAAALLVELNPLMIRQSGMALSEMQYVALLLFALMVYLHAHRLLAGIIAGLAYLTRPEALVFAGALLLYDALRFRQKAGLARLALGFLLVSLPYVGYLKASTGEWTVSPKLMNVRERGENLEENLRTESLQYRAPSFVERLEDGLAGYGPRAAGYGLHLLKFAGIAACALALLGLAGKLTPLFAGLVMLAILPVFGIKVEERFVAPYVPFIIVLAVIGLGMARKKWLVAAGLVLMAASVAPSVGFIVAPEDPGGFEYVEAGTAMRQLASPGDVFLDRKPFVAFYAGGSFRSLPNDSIGAILTYARDVRAKYIVFSERVLRLFRPQLKELANDEELLAQMGLVTVYQQGLGTGFGVRIVSIGQ